jgi:hypothetical protein
MILKESLAGTKACPFASCFSASRDSSSKCISSKCMAWDFLDGEHEWYSPSHRAPVSYRVMAHDFGADLPGFDMTGWSWDPDLPLGERNVGRWRRVVPDRRGQCLRTVTVSEE